VTQDAALMERVDELGKGKSGKVKKPAKQFLNRYGK